MGNGEPEEPEGRPIHFGNLVLFVFLVLSALLILVFGGWRRLWWLLPLGGGVFLFFFIASLWEVRWRAFTPEDKARGAPEYCPQCNEQVGIARRGQRYTIRCPICGYKQKGTFSAPPWMAQKEEKIPAVVYVLGIGLGAMSAYAVASLSQSPSLVAAVLGGLCGLGGVDPDESFIKKFGWAHAAVFFMISIGILLSVGPGEDDPFWLAVAWFLGNILLPVFVGGFAGELVFKLCCGLGGSRKRKGERMADKEEEIPQVIYFLGFVVGAISVYAVVSYAVASQWLPPFSPRAFVFVGGLAGYGAVYQRVGIFRFLLVALPVAGCWWIAIALLPVLLPATEPVLEFWAFLLSMIPVAAGALAGVLVFNLWKALARQRPGDR